MTVKGGNHAVTPQAPLTGIGRSGPSPIGWTPHPPTKETTMEQLLYTVEETGELFSCGRDKIYELINSGQLYSVKLGRLRRIPAASIERYLESVQVAPGAA